jgi:hypothetical protein
MTGEHLWSVWITKILGLNPYKMLRINEKGETNEWKARKLDMKAPVVCARCNNEWMSDLEVQHAKPAMEDLMLRWNQSGNILPLAALVQT